MGQRACIGNRKFCDLHHGGFVSQLTKILSAQRELAHEYFRLPGQYSAHIKSVCEVEMFREVSDQTLVALAPLFGVLFLGLVTARRRSGTLRRAENSFGQSGSGNA
jgi:hypothetical protein